MASRIYPARVYRSPRSGRFRLTFPDVPGCVSRGTDFNDCMRNGARDLAEQLAAMARLSGEIPEPSEFLAVIEDNERLDGKEAAEVFGVYPIKPAKSRSLADVA